MSITGGNGALVSASWANGKPLETLAEAIRSRVRTIQGETTERAVKATAIQALRSLRAETAIAAKNPEVIDERWLVTIKPTQYRSGWAKPGRHNPKGRRVIRMAGGHALDAHPGNKNRVVNLAGPYLQAGEAAVRVFALTIVERPATKPFYNSLVLALDRDAVWRFARRRIIRRIGQYRGISKRLLGIAMHQIASGQGGSSEAAGVLGRLAGNYCSVRMSGDGFNSGSFSVSVLDNLPKSALALKHGPAGVQLALKRAANSVAAVISKAAARTGFGDTWQTPFPEIAGGGKAPPTNFYSDGWVSREEFAKAYLNS